MTGIRIPVSAQRLVSPDGRVDRIWADWFRRIDEAANAGVLSGDQASGAIFIIATALGSPDGSVENIPTQLGDAQIKSEGTMRIVGSFASGVVWIDLGEMPDSGVGAGLVKITRDGYGRVQGTEAADTDDLAEGDTNLYFTDERAQDAVAAALTDTTTVTWDYNDATGEIEATVIAGTVGPQGPPGKDGQIRFTGHGAPGIVVGSSPGDTYMDLDTGDVYKLT